MESRNAKFLENDLINGSDRSQSIGFEKDHSDAQCATLSSGLIIVAINTPLSTNVCLRTGPGGTISY